MTLRIEDCLVGLKKLPTPPKLLFGILEKLTDENFEYKEIKTLIEKDPALAARFIKLSNSAYISPVDRIETLDRALATLGQNALRATVTAAAFKDIVPTKLRNMKSVELRYRSGLKATAMRIRLSQTHPHLSEEGFLTGLFSYLGDIVLAQTQPEIFKSLADSNGYVDSVKMNELYGFNTNDLTNALIDHWGISDVLKSDERCEPIIRVGEFASDLEMFMVKQEGWHKVLNHGLDSKQLFDFIQIVEEEMQTLADVLSFTIPSVLNSQAMLLAAAADMERQVSGLAETNQALEAQMKIDALTGVYNRGELDRILNKLAVDGQRFAVVMIDVDNFKSINDTYGHQFGDTVLRTLAAVLADGIRNGDIVARYGGEEFALVFPNTQKEQAWAITNRIRQEMFRAKIRLGDVGITKVSFSAGVGFTDGSKTVQSVFEEADSKLYEAKAAGKNKVLL